MTAAVFAGVASANFSGAVAISCTSATYTLTNFPSGQQDVLETVFVDGAVAAQATFSFTGPTAGPSVLSFSVPNDGLPHTIEANAYSLTNSTPVFGLPGIVTLTCGSAPPPPPSVCTYTKGFYRNHADVTAAVVAAMGGSVPLGSTMLNGSQVQSILNATPGSPGGVSFTSNLLLNLAQQTLAGELNMQRGSTASAGVQNAIASANAGIGVGTAGAQIQLSSSLSNDAQGALEATIEAYNSTNDCS
jgi:hypothetical protein